MNGMNKLGIVFASTLAAAAALAQDSQDKSQNARDSDETTVAQSNDKQGQKDRNAGQQRSGQAGSNVMLPVVTVLVPVEMESKSDTGLANGCWTKLFGEEQFKGDSLTLVGPVDMRQMTGPFGVEWGDKIDSLKVGPKATVTIYDNEDFKDHAATVKAQQHVPDLSERLGFFEEIKSIKIDCTGTAGSGAKSD